MLNKLIHSPFFWQSTAENKLPFKIDVDNNLYFFDLKVERLDRALVKEEYQQYIPDLAEVAQSYVMDQRMADMVYRILHAFVHNREPVILQGDTATSKTTAAIIAAAFLGLPVLRMNYSNQTTLGDLVGRVIPNYSGNAAEALQSDFAFKHGVIPRAMLNHCMLLNDEFNLAPLEVRTIFNSIMDNDPLLFIPETGEYLKKNSSDPTQDVSKNFFTVATQNKETYGARNKIGGDLQSRSRMCPEVKLPSAGELVEMMEFYINGTHPQIEYNKLQYQAKPIADPLLKHFQKLGGNKITELISVVAQFHFKVQGELEKARTGEGGLNARRQQVQVVSRRNIMNLFQILANFQAYDVKSNKIYTFFDQPAEVLALALDLVYTNQFMLDPEDEKIVLKIKKDCVNKTKMPELFAVNKNLKTVDADTPFMYEYADDAGVEYLVVHDQKIAKRIELSPNDRAKVPDAHFHSLDQETAEMYRNVAIAVNVNKSVLIEGPPAKAKTSGIETLAAKLNQPLIRLGLDGQVGVADFLGRWMPAFTKITEPNCKSFFQIIEEVGKDGVLTMQGRDISFLSEQAKQIYLTAMGDGRALSKEECKRIISIEGWHINDRSWSWVDGPVLLALDEGYWLIWDEVNHVDIGILDRFLPLLEDKPYLYIAENNGKSYSNDGRAGTKKINPHFRLFATMNPAEYIGKNALSPAFINRWPVFLQRKETDRKEIFSVIKYLINGLQPDIVLDGKKYSGKSEAPLLKTLAQLEDALSDDTKKDAKAMDLNINGLWARVADVFEFLASKINPLRLNADDRERTLAVDNETMQITIRLIRRLLTSIDSEKINNNYSAKFVDGRPVYEEMTVLSSNDDLKNILWKNLQLIILDTFNADDQAIIIAELKKLGLHPDNWQFTKVVSRKGDAENIRMLIRKYSASLNVVGAQKKATNKEQAEKLFDQTESQKKEMEEELNQFRKEAAVYNLADKPEIKTLEKQFLEKIKELNQALGVYSENILDYQFGTLNETIKDVED